MDHPIAPQSDWWSYLMASLLALGGSIARAGRWVDSKTGKFSLSLFGVELVTAIVIGSIAVGVGVEYALPIPVDGALAGGGGLLGPAAIVGLMQSYLKSRVGGVKDADPNKPAGD